MEPLNFGNNFIRLSFNQIFTVSWPLTSGEVVLLFVCWVLSYSLFLYGADYAQRAKPDLV